MNKTILIGKLGGDPESKYTQDGLMIANFTLATSEVGKDKGGNKTEKVEWHNITAFGKTAEICSTYLKKGSSVCVEGKIHYEKWEKDGVKHYKTVIILEKLEMLGKKQSEPQGIDREQPPIEDVPF